MPRASTAIALLLSALPACAGGRKGPRPDPGGPFAAIALSLEPPVVHAATEIHRALVARDLDEKPGRPGPAFPITLSVNDRLGSEAYRISPDSRELRIVGGDARGAMYGGLEVAEAIRAGTHPSMIEPRSGKPFLRHRQIKFNLPLPGTTYVSEEAIRQGGWFFDLDYWRAFLDEMARDRWNVLALWSAHPYAQMVRLEKYPEANGEISPERLEKNAAFFSNLFRMARERAIEPWLVTWNIHVSEGFAKAHGIPKDGHDSPLVRDYMRECVRGVLAAYPDLAGIGTCPGEAMPMGAKEREEWIRQTYVAGIADAGRPVSFLHRYWGADPVEARRMLAESSPGPNVVTIKYNGEHAFSSPRPHFLDRRWLAAPRNYDVVWHLRNDDLYTLRWADPEFVRATMQEVAKEGAGYLLGSECWIDGEDYLHTEEAAKHRTWRWDFERQRLRYAVFGRLGYDPGTPDARFVDRLAEGLGRERAEPLFRALVAASRIPTAVTSFHWNYMNGDWYVEGNVGGWNTGEGRGRNLRRDPIFHDVFEWIFSHTIDDSVVDIPEWVGAMARVKGDVERAKAGFDPDVRTPPEVADALEADAAAAWSPAAQAAAADAEGEAQCFASDLRAWNALGRYYAEKLRGATSLSLFTAGLGDRRREEAIAHLERAREAWADLARETKAHWREHEVWLMGAFSWERYAPDVDRDLEWAKAAKPDPAGWRTAGPWIAGGGERDREGRTPTMFPFDSLRSHFDFGVAPDFDAEPAVLGGDPAFLETEDFSGPWREQANYPGFRGRGFRCANVKGEAATTAIARRLRVEVAGTYSVWVRGLVGSASEPDMDRSCAVELDGTRLPATQTGRGKDPRFVWERAGEVRLERGERELRILDAGTGFEHPDSVALAPDPGFDPAWSGTHVLEAGGRAFDEWIRAEIDRAAERTAGPGPPASEVRSHLREAIGLARLPSTRPAKATVTGRIEREGFSVEKTILEPREGWLIPAHVYVPAGPGPHPAVLVPVGHWMAEGKMHATVQALAQSLVRRGFVVLAYDPIDQGERRVAGMSHRLGLLLLPAGLTDLALLVGDTLSAADHLASRPDVDARRIGITGCSGGGMNTLYAAALDSRFKAAALSCYLTTYRDLLLSGNHCEDNYVPGAAARFDMGHALGAIAPRPALVLAATRDFNSLEATREAFRAAEAMYAKAGAPDSLSLFADESDHTYSQAMRERAVGLFDRALRGLGDGAPVPESGVEAVPHDDPDWRVFPAGRLPDGAKSLLEVAREAIAERCRERAADSPDPARLRALLASGEAEPARLELEPPAKVLGVDADRLVFRNADSSLFGGLLLRPAAARGALVVALHDGGKEAFLAEKSDLTRALLAAGCRVLLLDPRGFGEGAGDEEKAWRVGVLAGRPLAGARLRDLLEALARVGSRPDLARGRIALVGVGPQSAFLALSAAALEPRVLAVGISGLPGSFADFAKPEAPAPPPALCIPGLLDAIDFPGLRALVAPRPVVEPEGIATLLEG